MVRAVEVVATKADDLHRISCGLASHADRLIFPLLL